MLVGQDFDKISFHLFGLDLLEANAVIGDTLIAIISLAWYFYLGRLKGESEYLKNWRYFFLSFSITYFLGGLGHGFYNYWQFAGKTPGLIMSLLPVYYIEQAMISLYPDNKKRGVLARLSKLKFVLALTLYLFSFNFIDFNENPSSAMLITVINSTLGLTYALGYLGFKYARSLHHSFNLLWTSVLVLLISLPFQLFKINFHPLFDRNDVGHLLILVALFLYGFSLIGFLNRDET